MNVTQKSLGIFKNVLGMMKTNTGLLEETGDLVRKISDLESANARLYQSLADQTNKYKETASVTMAQISEQADQVNRLIRERDELVAQRDGQRWLVKDADGITLLLDKESLIDLHVFYHNRWEQDRLEYMVGLIEKVGLVQDSPLYFMDVGSYFGQYALVIKQKFPTVSTYCFEANPYNYAQLKANLMLNNLLQHVTTYNRCVTDRPGQMNVHVPDGNRGASKVGDEYTGIRQAAFLVDNLVFDNEFKDLVDCMIFVKMDIENMETAALTGMRELVQRNKVIIQIENWDYAKGGSDSILREYGFSVKRGMHPDYFYANFTMDTWPISQA
jgi:FkbM family methyltransferase